ncbi:aminotransferase class I/II-fold pyridoxal phosphate-dependent enzyme [Echinicola jeungdonensis]|uniref:Aminotransferase class I/II-fold pyridoxal phosphate-dependent enzyme n=1 Tax=Echinicola jeungdonensis TaxID=709343 RepID=A0ABV5J7H3_9BACT|nr:aminotransferase class I/II-fold pyridoxal phosphate-dependent enzyme [Echinicola jeungdonensis]MDN3669764.1 aminotransferase class I/II-fold pyridoxal phosphate-dependent enzyme [Echinicola jeungdonensis]
MIDTLNQIVEDGFRRKLVHNYTEDEQFEETGNVTIEGTGLVNFGSCSYLGLENDPKLKEGVVHAVTQYGTQFSSSRTYLSIGLYLELETLLQQIFKKPLIVTASTTLGHLAAIPVLVGEKDAVIIDLQAHSSIQMTIQQLKAKKIPIFVIKHNSMEALETKIQNLNNKYDKIWYFADGVYSMYGDYASFGELEKLLNKYEKFHLYIDDAHGMGWTGKNGCGVVRSKMAHHEKMVLAVSLNKSFAAAGGCLVFPNKDLEKKVRNCGSTYIFSGPIQSPMLGAAIASAKLHLSNEINQRQGHLKKLIAYTNKRLDELHLPQFEKGDSPLFFIPVGLPKISYDIISQMKTDGFYLNTASFPAVPMKKSGIRFMINNRLGKSEIDAMLCQLQKNYIKVITDAGSSCEEVANNFNIPTFDIPVEISSPHGLNEGPSLVPILHRSILEENKEEWEAIFLNNGTLNYDNVTLVERTFSQQNIPENNWEFYYFTIKDQSGKTILKTFFTVSLTKDDMFSSGQVSEKVEKERLHSPYYLTSKSVISGSLITKGDHIFIDYEHKSWKRALEMLVDKMNQTLTQTQATKIMLRDFYGEQDLELKTTLLELGFTSFKLPNNLILNSLDWDSTETYLQRLNQKYRYNVRKEILKFEQRFILKFEKPNTEKELLKYYQLYEQVYHKSYDFNVFKLPLDYFKAMVDNSHCDFIQLYLKPEFSPENNIEEPVLVGVMFSQVNQSLYNALIVGLNYDFVYKQNTYKQILYQTVQRAKQLGCQKLDLAFTAELEKKKLGARPIDVYAYVQSTEHYNFNVLESL